MTEPEDLVARGDLRGGALAELLVRLEREHASGTLLVRQADGASALLVLLRGRVAQVQVDGDPPVAAPACERHAVRALAWSRGRFLFRPFTRPPRSASGPSLSPSSLLATRAVEGPRGSAERLLDQARLALHSGAWNATMRFAEAAWDAGGRSAEVYALLGYARFMAADQPEDIADGCFALLREAERQDPALEVVHVYAAAIHQRLGQHAQARARLSRVR